MSDDEFYGLIFGSICGVRILGGIAFLVLGTIFKMPFGINFRKARCGECDTPAPRRRAPNSLYEMLWGGWTCDRCGCSNDKWGNPR